MLATLVINTQGQNHGRRKKKKNYSSSNEMKNLASYRHTYIAGYIHREKAGAGGAGRDDDVIILHT